MKWVALNNPCQSVGETKQFGHVLLAYQFDKKTPFFVHLLDTHDQQG